MTTLKVIGHERGSRVVRILKEAKRALEAEGVKYFLMAYDPLPEYENKQVIIKLCPKKKENKTG